MKKKLIIASILILTLVALPVAVYAYGESRVVTAQDYYVDKFTDNNTTCYVAYHSKDYWPLREAIQDSVSISCVK